jgi:hypothetical protein
MSLYDAIEPQQPVAWRLRSLAESWSQLNDQLEAVASEHSDAPGSFGAYQKRFFALQPLIAEGGQLLLESYRAGAFGRVGYFQKIVAGILGQLAENESLGFQHQFQLFVATIYNWLLQTAPERFPELAQGSRQATLTSMKLQGAKLALSDRDDEHLAFLDACRPRTFANAAAELGSLVLWEADQIETVSALADDPESKPNDRESAIIRFVNDSPTLVTQYQIAAAVLPNDEKLNRSTIQPFCQSAERKGYIYRPPGKKGYQVTEAGQKHADPAQVGR